MFISICIRLSPYTFMRVYEYIYSYIYINIYLYVYIYIYIYIPAHARARARARTRARTCARTCTRTRTSTHILIHTRARTHTHTHLHVHIHTCTLRQTYTLLSASLLGYSPRCYMLAPDDTTSFPFLHTNYLMNNEDFFTTLDGNTPLKLLLPSAPTAKYP